MKEMMEYKGYHGSISYSKEDELLYGKIEFIRDLVVFHGKSVKEIEKAFKESVEDYFLTCKQTKKEPDRPFKGSFNVRTGEELHRDACIYANNNDISLNEVVSKAIREFLTKKEKTSNTKIRNYKKDEATSTFNEVDLLNRWRQFDMQSNTGYENIKIGERK